MSKIRNCILAFKPLLNNLIFRFVMGFPLTILALKISSVFTSDGHDVLGKIFLTIGAILFLNLIMLSLVNQMTDRVYSFHEEHNSDNLDKNPIKFAFKYRKVIYLYFKWSFIISISIGILLIWCN
ncbi:hypothetical protein EDF78_101503 [Rahnella sp. BIGb0236]|uniref:hypothetical protein n=1 Tax=Rahnella sp. BIGb0236 TaxID=2485117 RepID=UPI0010613D58|nr:hypothetical protein [Rahnella sp. BIGb0236]TDS98126.1 hypothetical protein EDF78_101503 [Rahnella sp. BIGb0236]VTQ52265.1 Uncharacterised protein [Campylobacter jejuni]